MENNIYKINGSSFICINYDGTTSYLEIDKAIIAVNIAGPYQINYNSYFIRGNFNSSYVNNYLKQFNFDFYTDHNFFNSKHPQIEKFLESFEPGTYYIEQANNFFISILESDYKLLFGDFSTQDHALLFTRNIIDLKRNIINAYKDEIIRGDRPVILSHRKDYGYGSETGDSFIIGGHHKLMAYIELEIEPNIWEIVSIGDDNYDPTNQILCAYLNHEEIKNTSLKYFYRFTVNRLGELSDLASKF